MPGWLLVISGFVTQVLAEVRLLYRGSAFAGPVDLGSERRRLAAAWAPLVGIAMMGSLLAFAVVALR